ncbi:nuclear transport factor 2 family protein [Flavobacterium sp. ANB]|uniref:nuclear transport factor 2 family protein n=1 Tax=unclassified Flavobacterium TaxID=196869 RepID=UPI0012B85439|nr:MULTISPECIES: nuclear transport factor 2 family protein [unclassified Flavobacterium]MBF4516953.1 nuclear transport factor 2 family protein [Flavobacterium sp. ANB]MTD69151.1 nuclear transport factor 2 family protein [Flavobacterium sp. LC2016-13]
MPKLETIEQFIEMVESNEHDKAIEKFYTIDASIQENQSEPRVGRDNLVANEKNTLLKVKSLVSKCIRPYFIQDDHVVIQWFFRFEWKNGTVSEIEEIAYQKWEGELIKTEKFFYDPKQLTGI